MPKKKELNLSSPPEVVYGTAWAHKCTIPFSTFTAILQASYNILEQTAGYCKSMYRMHVVRKAGQNNDVTTITKPKQPKLLHHAAPTLYLNTINLRLVYKLERKTNERS